MSGVRRREYFSSDLLAAISAGLGWRTGIVEVNRKDWDGPGETRNKSNTDISVNPKFGSVVPPVCPDLPPFQCVCALPAVAATATLLSLECWGNFPLTLDSRRNRTQQSVLQNHSP
ncbi:MAG: hypothetical protein JWM11_3661 [Planctomycetaceae bacterium]|nr:hypothetical protein [Planctomycetaceae bacterium]